MPQISKSAKYTIDDFEPIAVTGMVPLVLIVSKNVRANNLQEFIAEMRAAPGKYTYGGGIGSPPHILGAWFNRVNNLNVMHIPYRGGGQAVADVVAGHIDMFYSGLAAAKGAINSGSVKALAVTGDARSSALPNVPTFKEAGTKDFELASWNVLLVPKGTPADIVTLLRKETALALGRSENARDVRHARRRTGPGRGSESIPCARARRLRPRGARHRHQDGLARARNAPRVSIKSAESLRRRPPWSTSRHRRRRGP